MANFPPDSYIDPANRAILDSAAANSSDYKALVCLNLFGGFDSHNMVIPYNGPNRQLYENARAYAVRFDLSELTASQLTGTNPLWSLNPSLSNFLKMWKDGNLAIIRNVGVLNKPTTKEQFLADESFRPNNLFAHNIQQEAWQIALPAGTYDGTGWFGRSSSLIDDSFNPNTRISSSVISSSGDRTQLNSYAPQQASIHPPVVLSSGSARGANVPLFNAARDLSYHKNGFPIFDSNLIHNSFRDIFKRSVDSQEELSINVTNWNRNDGGIGQQIESVFIKAATDLAMARISVPNWTAPGQLITDIQIPQQYFLGQIKNVARIIYSHKYTGGIGLDQRRQLIFAALGGWDHHQILRYQHDTLLKLVDICVNALFDALTIMGLENSVTLFSVSEFSRTFRSNGTFGVDHAWGGHTFVAGGAVKGGLYGPEPDYTLGGSEDIHQFSQGLFVPHYSLDQYYGTLLKWFDVPPSLISLVLPAQKLYTPVDIGFL